MWNFHTSFKVWPDVKLGQVFRHNDPLKNVFKWDNLYFCCWLGVGTPTLNSQLKLSLSWIASSFSDGACTLFQSHPSQALSFNSVLAAEKFSLFVINQKNQWVFSKIPVCMRTVCQLKNECMKIDNLMEYFMNDFDS